MAGKKNSTGKDDPHSADDPATDAAGEGAPTDTSPEERLPDDALPRAGDESPDVPQDAPAATPHDEPAATDEMPEETTDGTDRRDDAESAPVTPDADAPKDDSPAPADEPIDDGVDDPADDPAAGTAAEADAEAGSDADTTPEPGMALETETAPDAQDVPEGRAAARAETEPQIVERPVSILPLLLGGVIAGAIGFAAAFYGMNGDGNGDAVALEQRVESGLEAVEGRIDTLADQIGALPPPADLSPLEAAQQELSGTMEDLTGRLAALEDAVDAVDTRLSEVEKRPVSEGASDAAIAAYERELQALQEAMATQRAEVEAMTEEAARMEENAAATARATAQRAALSRIQSALDSGAAFDDAVARLQETAADVPDDLREVAAEGVPTLDSLQDGFPPAARAALAATRQATDGDAGNFADFLRSQLGARSLTPRAGDDPDAVLSRAEAALRESRLRDALSELEALPEPGRAALSDWVSDANRRLGALDAAEALGQQLN